MAIGDLAQGGEEAIGWDHVAALAQDRLHQECGHVIGVDEGGEDLFDPRQAEGQGSLVGLSGRVAQDVRVRGEVDPAEERLVVAAILDP